VSPVAPFMTWVGGKPYLETKRKSQKRSYQSIQLSSHVTIIHSHSLGDCKASYYVYL